MCYPVHSIYSCSLWVIIVPVLAACYTSSNWDSLPWVKQRSLGAVFPFIHPFHPHLPGLSGGSQSVPRPYGMYCVIPTASSGSAQGSPLSWTCLKYIHIQGGVQETLVPMKASALVPPQLISFSSKSSKFLFRVLICPQRWAHVKKKKNLATCIWSLPKAHESVNQLINWKLGNMPSLLLMLHQSGSHLTFLTCVYVYVCANLSLWVQFWADTCSLCTCSQWYLH